MLLRHFQTGESFPQSAERSPGLLRAVIWLFLIGSGASLCAADTTNGWTRLFDGRSFDGLDRYIGPLPGSKQPLGLNNDPRGVFTVTNIDNRGAIHVSGELYGAVTTHAEFGNAQIRVRYKWGEKKWPP